MENESNTYPNRKTKKHPEIKQKKTKKKSEPIIFSDILWFNQIYQLIWYLGVFVWPFQTMQIHQSTDRFHHQQAEAAKLKHTEASGVGLSEEDITKNDWHMTVMWVMS